MKFLLIVNLMLLSLVQMACTTLEIPAGTNLSPELSNRPVELGVDSAQTRVLYLAQDSDINNSTITTKDGGAFRAGAIPSVYAMLNFGGFLGIAKEAGGYRLQLQLLGDSRQEAKPGNISFSVFAGADDFKMTQSNLELANPAKSLVSSGATGKVVSKVNSQIYGGILGVRTSPVTVIGLLYYKQKFSINAKGDLEDKTSGSTVSTAGVEINNEFIDTAIGLPLFIGGNTFEFQISPIYVEMYEPIMSKKVNYVLTNFKFSWTFP